MAVNNYFVFIDWKQAVDIAKCCIAKKQASQVAREANLMGRCADTDSEIQFLQASLYLLNTYTYGGDFNQITDAECLELIQRIGTMCNCEDEEPYDVPSACSSTVVCIGGSYQQDGGDPVVIPNQTVYLSLDCSAPFELATPEGNIDVVIEPYGDDWVISSDGEILATNDKLIGTYNFVYDIATYSLSVSSGACS